MTGSALPASTDPLRQSCRIQTSICPAVTAEIYRLRGGVKINLFPLAQNRFCAIIPGHAIIGRISRVRLCDISAALDRDVSRQQS